MQFINQFLATMGKTSRWQCFVLVLLINWKCSNHNGLAISTKTVTKNGCHHGVSVGNVGSLAPASLTESDYHLFEVWEGLIDEFGLVFYLAVRIRLIRPLTARQVHQIQLTGPNRIVLLISYFDHNREYTMRPTWCLVHRGGRDAPDVISHHE